MRKIICKNCGERFDPDQEGAWIENVGDCCSGCYSELIETCQLCSEEVQSSEISDFIVCKTELSITGDRPPGIYRVLNWPFMTSSMLGGGWIHSYDLLFIDKLPKPDEQIEISGKLCRKCAAPYQRAYRLAYGHRSPGSFGFSKRGWELQKSRTRNVILANPEMLRDLECDADSYKFRKLKEIYDLPDGLPTYHEWIFVKHKGVKVFYAGYKRADSWMTWHPEPKYRTNGHGPHCFAPSGLPAYEKHAPTHDSSGYEYSCISRDLIAARPAVIEAIELGILRQDGVFDQNGKELVCR